MEAIRREAAEVRVVAPPYEEGKRHEIEADEWVSLAGCHTPEKVEAAIREAVGRDDWEIIQTAMMPLGITVGDHLAVFAEFAEGLDEAQDRGIGAEQYYRACDAAGYTVDPAEIHAGECPECGDLHDPEGGPDENGNRFMPEEGRCSNCAETA